MAGKISEMDAASTLDGNELIEAVQSGSNKKISLDSLFSAPLWGDREIDLNGHVFEIEDGENYLLKFDPGVEDVTTNTTQIQSIRGNNTGYCALLTQDTFANAQIQALFNSGATFALIIGYADETTAKVTLGTQNASLEFDGIAGTLKAPLSGGFSTDNGTNNWKLGAASGGAPTPDSTIEVNINGTLYLLAAQASG